MIEPDPDLDTAHPIDFRMGNEAGAVRPGRVRHRTEYDRKS